MEMVNWAILWQIAKVTVDVLAAIWSVVVMFIFLFFGVAVWRLIPRLDALLALDKAVGKTEKHLPPKEFRETMAEHERAVKRLSEGLDP